MRRRTASAGAGDRESRRGAQFQRVPCATYSPIPHGWLAAASSAYHYLKVTVDGAGAVMEAIGFDADGVTFEDRAVLRWLGAGAAGGG